MISSNNTDIGFFEHSHQLIISLKIPVIIHFHDTASSVELFFKNGTEIAN